MLNKEIYHVSCNLRSKHNRTPHRPARVFQLLSKKEAADIFLCAGYKNTVMNNHLSVQDHGQSVSDPSDTEHEED